MTDDLNLPSVPSWQKLRSLTGGSEFVPHAVERLILASSKEEATAAYWELDNRVVVQGQLFQAAAWTTRLVCRAVCEGNASEFGLYRAVSLLVEIAAGKPDSSELTHGNEGLGETCRVELRAHLPCLRALAQSSDEETLLAVMDLLDLVELDRQQISRAAELILARSASPIVRSRAIELLNAPS